MIIDLLALKSSSKDVYETEIVFDEEFLKGIDLLKEVKYVKAKVTVEKVHPYLMIKIKLDGELVLYSSRSLKEIPFSLNDEEELTFLLEKLDDDISDDLEIIKGNELDLTPYINMLFESSIPFSIVTEDEEDSLSGDSWELISEEEYYKRKESSNNAFKDLENFFDDEEE